MKSSSSAPKALAVACCLLVAGCASYQSLPLAEAPTRAAEIGALNHEGVALGAPLTLAAVARLAIENNPDLLTARAQIDVAHAQLLQASLPPNPQVTGAILPLVAGYGYTLAWNSGIGENLTQLITLGARRASAEASAQQVDAQVLWQEWQTIGQARLLAIDLIQGARLVRLLTANRDLLAGRTERSQRALARADATIATVAPDLAALQAAQTALDDATRQQLSRRHQLAALLGLRPDAALPLADRADLPPITAAAVMTMLPTLAARRPDLVALQYGYRAEDAKLRAAILSQFPNLIFGATGGSDNANVRNAGPQVSLDLPVFDRNQGNVAIESTTRQQLHDEYAARVAGSDGQVRAMLSEIAQLRRQRELAARDLSRSASMAARGEEALRAGNLDERSYVELVAARLTHEQEIVTLDQSLLEQQVAIATLIGAGLPSLTTLEEKIH